MLLKIVILCNKNQDPVPGSFDLIYLSLHIWLLQKKISEIRCVCSQSFRSIVHDKAKGSCKILLLLRNKPHVMDLQEEIITKFQSSIFS